MTHAYYEEWQIVFCSDAEDKLSFDDFFFNNRFIFKEANLY